MTACRAFVEKCWASTIAKGGHDHNVLSNLKFVSASPGHLRTSLVLERRHVNNHKTAHGGVLLSLTDTVTSLTLSTLGLPPPTGVSVNVSCEFVRPAGKEGDELIGVGEVVKVGRTLAYTRISFYSMDKLVAFGSHTKHMGNSEPVVRFSEDGEDEIPLAAAVKAKL